MFRRITSAFPRPIVWASILFFIAIVVLSWWRWWTFRYTTFDLAFYIQALSEALAGRWHLSLLDVPLLGNHAEPIVFLALPLYAAWPHPMLLVILQTLAVASMPFLAWKIARRLDLGEKESLALALATIIAPATGWMALHEFHPETLSAPLILAVANARLAKRYWQFWFWWVLLAGCKENLALMLVTWAGVFSVIEFRQGWRHLLAWNIAPGLLAGSWLVAYGGWLSPMLNGGKVDYLELYSHLGRNGPEIVTRFFTEPSRVLGALQHSLSQGNLLPGIILPWLGLMLLRPRWLIIGAPIIFQHLLSWRSSEWDIRCHYGAPLIALAWLGVAETIVHFRSRLRWALGVLAGSAVGQLVIGPCVEVPGEIADARRHWEERKWKAELLEPIQARRELSVFASLGFLPHLADRRELHSLHHLLKGLKTLSRTRYNPPQVDVVAVDFGDAATFSPDAGYYHPRMRTVDGEIVPSSDALLDAYLARSNWTERAINAVRVFERTGAAPTSPREPLPEFPTTAEFSIKPDHSAAVQIRTHIPEDRSVFQWAMLTASRGETILTVPLGPVALGSRNSAEIETWSIRWPSEFERGRYEVAVQFYDPLRSAQAEPPDQALNRVTWLKTVKLGTLEL